MDIIKLAREAGMTVFVAESLGRFTDLVLEEAAKVCEERSHRNDDMGAICAAAIRQTKHNVVNIDK